MAKITELSDGGSLQSTDYLIAVRSGGNVKVQADGNLSLGTVTALGLTVDGTATIDGGASANTVLTLDSSTANTYLKITDLNSTNGTFIGATTNDLNFYPNNVLSATFAAGGDISFYEDTGTTAKFFWDASAESLGIGTSSPTNLITVNSTTGAGIKVYGADQSFSRIAIDNLNGQEWNLVAGTAGASNSGFGIYDVDAGATRLQIDSSGNVGIGTTSIISGARLDVRGANANNLSSLDAQVLTVQDTTSYAANVGGGIAFGYKFNSAGASFQRGAVIKAVKENGTDGDYSTSMAFATVANGGQTSEKMRIDSSGNLLVGKTVTTFGTDGHTLWNDGLVDFSRTATSATMRVNKNSNDGDLISFSKDGTTVGSIGVSGVDFIIDSAQTDSAIALQWDDAGTTRKLQGYQTAFRVNTANDAAVDLGASGSRFKDLYLSGGALTSTVKFLANTTVSGSDATIFRPADNTMAFSTNGAERMRIDSSGNLLVGTTTSSSRMVVNGNTGGIDGVLMQQSTAGGYSFVSDAANNGGTYYHFAFKQASTAVGSITSTGSTTDYNTSSDQRLKDNIVDAPSASDDIDAIQVRSFDWKVDGSHQKYGMVAQELLTVAPEAVHQPEDPEEMMGVDYSKLVPMMLKEIQSLRARVAQLEGAN